MKFKPCFRSKLLQHSDVPTAGSFANGFAILSQRPLPHARRLTGCYASILLCAILQTGNAYAQGDPCVGSPSEAVFELPNPLAEWGNVYCTPFGHIVAPKEGWIWSQPGGYFPVMIPSQMVRDKPESLGNDSYFTEIQLSEIGGETASEAITHFESGFDSMDVAPKVYAAKFRSVSGKTLKLQFFDYGDSIWGIWCRESCDLGSRFMIMNMER